MNACMSSKISKTTKKIVSETQSDHQKYFKGPLGGTSIEKWIKTADFNIDKLFLKLNIFRENILSAARGL